MPHRKTLLELLNAFHPVDEQECSMHITLLNFVQREPACFERSTPEGHLTGSAWIIDPQTGRVVLLHHAKLGKWLQPGGHADGDTNLERVARREALEETGLTELKLLGSGIFDVDIHPIPPRGKEPGHFHFDVRFAFAADSGTPLKSNSESVALEWAPLDKVPDYTKEESILRMLRKTAGIMTGSRIRPE